MGSDLYVSIEVQFAGDARWRRLWRGTSCPLARGLSIVAFSDCKDAHSPKEAEEQRRAKQEEDCPWHDYEPYWVRLMDGREFCAIIREQRWQALYGGRAPELRAYATIVEALLAEGTAVRVWCWESQ
jgi:hypothetical protein